MQVLRTVALWHGTADSRLLRYFIFGNITIAIGNSHAVMHTHNMQSLYMHVMFVRAGLGR